MPRIISVLACLLTTAFAQNADWRFIHPDAKVFVGVKLRHVLQAPVATQIEGELQGLNLPDLTGIPGSELFRQIDELFVSSPGPAPDAAPDAQPPLLIRLTGRFEAARVEAFLRKSGASLQTYLKHRVYRHKGDGDMAATLLDAHTLLIGDAPSLFAALERLDWSADATPRNPLLARAVELDATSDIWAVFAVAPSSFTQLPQLPSLDGVHGMELALNVNDGLEFHLALNTDSPDEAAKLAAGLNQLLAVGMKMQASSPDVAALGKNLRFGVDEATVRLKLSVTPLEMKKAIAGVRRQIQQQAQVAALHAAATPTPAASVQPAAPPVRKVIRIDGLDDGPREIPYTPYN